MRPVYNSVLDIDLRPGGRLRYMSPDLSRVFVAGEVLEVDPPRRLRHTCIFTMAPDPVTEVTWELEEVPEGCKVTLTHSGLDDREGRQEARGGLGRDPRAAQESARDGRYPYKDQTHLWRAGPLHVGAAEVDQGGELAGKGVEAFADLPTGSTIASMAPA